MFISSGLAFLWTSLHTSARVTASPQLRAELLQREYLQQCTAPQLLHSKRSGPGWPQTHLAQAGFKFLVLLLPQTPRAGITGVTHDTQLTCYLFLMCHYYLVN